MPAKILIELNLEFRPAGLSTGTNAHCQLQSWRRHSCTLSQLYILFHIVLEHFFNKLNTVKQPLDFTEMTDAEKSQATPLS